MPLDVGVGVAAAVAFGSKFVERSKFSSRHDGIYDKELEKSLKAVESFQNIPKEDVDFFEAEEYNLLHSKSTNDLMDYRSAQDEYKEKEWVREPRAKYRLRGRVREAKRRLQSSVSQERSHVDELETYSRSVHSRSSSVLSFASDGSRRSGLDLDRSRHYRTDSVSIRAVNHSPPSASLEDVSCDETREVAHDHISQWLSSIPRPLTTAQQLAESYRSRSSNPVVVEDSGVVRKSILRPPKLAPSPWQLYFTDWIQKQQASGIRKLNVAQAAKEAGQEYALLSPAEKEPYKRRSQAMKEAREKEHDAYMRSLSPEDIKRENAFRAAQRKAGKSRKANLRDRNAPKKPLSAYFMFLQHIRANPKLVAETFGDERETTKQSVLAAWKWRSMTDAERQPFLAQAEQEKMDYEAARRVYEEGSNPGFSRISFSILPESSYSSMVETVSSEEFSQPEDFTMDDILERPI